MTRHNALPPLCEGTTHRFNLGERVCRCGKQRVAAPRYAKKRLLPFRYGSEGEHDISLKHLF